MQKRWAKVIHSWRVQQVLVLDTLRSAEHSLGKGHFGLFDGDTSTVFFEARLLTLCR